MSACVSRSSTALLAVGAVGILCLGAFSRLEPLAVSTPALPDLAADSSADLSVESAGEPKLPANLSPGLTEIIRLAKGHVDENVILAFIQNSGQTYSPTADEIMYLSNLGLSHTVVAALFKRAPSARPEMDAAASTTTVASAGLPPLDFPPAAQSGNVELSYNTPVPYDTGRDVPDNGLCWQLATTTLIPDWHPYVIQSGWLHTEHRRHWRFNKDSDRKRGNAAELRIAPEYDLPTRIAWAARTGGGGPWWEPANNRETFHRERNVETLARAPEPDPARMMAMSTPANSKSGK